MYEISIYICFRPNIGIDSVILNFRRVSSVLRTSGVYILTWLKVCRKENMSNKRLCDTYLVSC